MTRSIGYYVKQSFKVLILIMVFVSLSKVLWHVSELYFSKEKERDLTELWVKADGKTDTVRQYQRLIVHSDRVDISGASPPSVEVVLTLNERKTERIFPQSHGKFTFFYIQLHRGLNKIEITRTGMQYSDPERYELVFQKKTPGVPIVLSYQFQFDQVLHNSRMISMIGVGEPCYTYLLRLGTILDSVQCDEWGNFHVSRFVAGHDTIATFLSNSGKDTLANAAVHSERGQDSAALPMAFSRTTELDVDTGLTHVQAKLTVRGLPVASALYENIASGNIDALDFASAMFGDIEFREYYVAGQAFSPTITAYHDYANIALRAQWDFSEKGQIPAVSFFPPYGLFPLDSLILQIPERSVYSLTIAPDAFTGDRRIWVGPKASPGTFECSFNKQVDVQKRTRGESEKRNHLPENVISWIAELPTNVFGERSPFVSVLQSTLLAIFSAIPLVWWLWLIGRHKEKLGRLHKTLLGTFALLTFYHFFSPVLWVVENIVGFILSSLLNVDNNWNLRFTEWYGPRYQDIGKFLVAGILLFSPLALALVTAREPHSEKLSSWVKVVQGFGLSALSLLFGYMFVERSREQVNQLLSVEVPYFVFLCIAAIVAFIVLILLVAAARNIVGTALRISSVQSKIYGVLLVMIGLPVLFDALTSAISIQWFPKPPLLWAFASTGFGAILLYSGMNVALRLFTKPLPVRKTWANALLILGFALIAFPKSLLHGAASTFVNYSFLSAFFSMAVSMFPFVVLLSIVVLLYEESVEHGYRLDSSSKEWGLLLVSFFVVESGCGSGYSWMYIPISLITAYLLSRQYLFLDPETASDRLQRNESPLKDRKSSIQKVISYLVFKKEFKDLKKLFDKKFAANEIEYADWEKKTADNKSVLSSLRNQAMQDNVPLEKVIFSHGIEASPWGNALLAMKTGAWLAIVWIFVFIREVRTWEVNKLYPLFNLADSFLYSILAWFIIAFVFGYYYHTLRGNTGTQKGAWFGLVIILARIGPSIFFADSIDEIQKLLIWGIQVFAYCMFIGFFAFDFRILRKNDFEWQDVVVIYNLAALSTFGSGLLAALLGILSGQLQALFGNVLGRIIPK